MIKKVLILFSFSALLLWPELLFTQQNSFRANWSNSSPFEHKVFIENKGQFDWVDNGSGKKTVFGASFCDVDVHFSSTGLTYTKFELQTIPDYEPRKDGKVKKEKAFYKVPHHAYLEWVGCNKDVKIISEKIQEQYYTYASMSYKEGKESVKASAVKKIIYKDLYPNIDVEYSFPDDKSGIKYTIILHPGADASVVKMKYSGEVSSSLSSEGNLLLDVYADNITDHAPVSFLQKDNTPVSSSFKLENNVVTFSLADYDKSQTLIIDPWTIVPTFGGYNAAYDVEYDFQGNVYVYGGRGTVGNPFQEIKYNNAGVQQWVYTWTTAIITPSYGDFTVDGASGSSYIIEGYNPPVPVVLKVNSAGTQTAIYNGNVWMNEMWRITYNNCTKQMIIGGGGTGNTTYQAAIIDTNLTAMTAYNVLSASTDLHDITLLTIDNAGNYYMASAKSMAHPTVLDNVFLKGPASTILPRAYMLPDNHAFLEVGSIGYIANQGVSSPTAFANGFNGMGVSNKYLYTYDGQTIRRWNKLTGAFMNSAVLSPSPFNWGGLAVDECDNIFAGVQQSVKQLDTNFTILNTLVVPNDVYDVRLAPGNLLYACGNQFVSSFNVTLPTCSSLNATASSVGSCTSGTATVTATGGSAPYTYNWNPSGQTTPIATGLVTGTYSVTVSDGGCVPSSITVTVSVTAGALTSSVTSTPAACLLNNGTATVTPAGGTLPYTYSWSPTGGAAAVATGLAPGTYTITLTDGSGCTGTSTVNISSVGGTTVSLLNQTNVSCNGGNNGTATFSASGGTSPYTYTWSPSGGANASASGLSVGTYTVLVADAAGCTQTQTVSISQPTVITSTATSTQASCGSNNGTASVGATGGTGAYTYAWSPSGGNTASASGLAAGNYSILISDANGCTKTQTVSVTQPSTIAVTASATQTNCLSNTGTATAVVSGGSGPFTYNWSPAGGNNAIATGLAAGSYTATVTDANGCSQSAVAVVNVLGGPTANAGANVTIVDGNTASLSGTGGVSYSWSPSANLSCSTCSSPNAHPSATTTYTLIVTDANGCTDADEVTVFVEPVDCSNKPNAGYFYLPNAFSPNSDGQNDELCLLGWDECLTAFSIKIFNRWGELVFESDTRSFCWDGTYNGKELNEAVFAFAAKAVLYNGVEKDVKGNISLIR